jgi:hypothetical protein
MATEILTSARATLALKAAWEIASISHALQIRFADADADDLRFRALAIRLERLASMQMSALDDDQIDTDELRAELVGPHMTRQARGAVHHD